ncbi:MerR family transcriptional regulator [Alteribacter keqinensis]|uniref:MerR family transcriptional regulator n=1 Tax=Alteribacter keqinensis TaxID=2483800 RepID=A0A3M7TUI7_9BACI|nr:MerR family transcriptional regulator [Alteribacter keqinensis]RNA69113.1 MerR family transcriptional regulator [Alteribacter keqinensis]
MGRIEGKYNIKAVSNMLGIQAGTLRAWERRYDIIEPVRNQAGHRLYTDEHVAVLRWLINKVNKGFTIGQAVGLLEDHDLNDMPVDTANENDRASSIKEELFHALLRFQEHKSNQILDQAFGMFSIEKVMTDILGKILVEIGDKWEEGEISSAHEHYITAFLRTKIGSVFHNLPVDGLLPKVVCVCGPDETHEIGLLIFTLYLRRRGYEVIYLGSGVPKEDLNIVVDEVKPKMVFISCTMTRHLKGTFEAAEDLKEKFEGVRVGVGGNALMNLSAKDEEKYEDMLLGFSPSEWEQWIRV